MTKICGLLLISLLLAGCGLRSQSVTSSEPVLIIVDANDLYDLGLFYPVPWPVPEWWYFDWEVKRKTWQSRL